MECLVLSIIQSTLAGVGVDRKVAEKGMRNTNVDKSW